MRSTEAIREKYTINNQAGFATLVKNLYSIELPYLLNCFISRKLARSTFLVGPWSSSPWFPRPANSFSWLPRPANSTSMAWRSGFQISGSLTIQQSSGPQHSDCTLNTQLSRPCLISPTSCHPHLVRFSYYIWKSGEQVKLFYVYRTKLYFCYLYIF